MNVTKLSIFAEIDGVVCYIPSSQFPDLEMAIEVLAIISVSDMLKCVKAPDGFKFQEMEIEK
jgi:hypothetical protein